MSAAKNLKDGRLEAVLNRLDLSKMRPDVHGEFYRSDVPILLDLLEEVNALRFDETERAHNATQGLGELADRIKDARALHAPRNGLYGAYCNECRSGSWPCATATALAVDFGD